MINYNIYLQKAISNPLEKDRLLPNVFEKIERNLFLLGSTAIEDQLQDDVDDCLNSFIETGIKVWVLTGDKTDTAKSIAFSCNLITHEFVLFEFKENSSSIDIKNSIKDFLNKIIVEPKDKYGLIVSIDEINKIMNNEHLREKVIIINLII
jgi:magnesium-transporting ATPase (P-type)